MNMKTSTKKILTTWLSKIVIRTLKGNKVKIFRETKKYFKNYKLKTHLQFHLTCDNKNLLPIYKKIFMLISSYQQIFLVFIFSYQQIFLVFFSSYQQIFLVLFFSYQQILLVLIFSYQRFFLVISRYCFVHNSSYLILSNLVCLIFQLRFFKFLIQKIII